MTSTNFFRESLPSYLTKDRELYHLAELLKLLQVSQTGETLASLKLREIAILLIEQKVFITDPQVFADSLSKSRHPLMLTPYSVPELSTMSTFTLPHLSIGYALKNSERGCEIVGVHNNEEFIHNIGTYLVQSAIEQGGNCLDHFGSDKLNDLYESVGLVEVYREPFDPKYDLEGKFEEQYGQLPVIYRKLKGKNEVS